MTDGAIDPSTIKVSLPGIRANKQIPKRKLEYAAKLRELLGEYRTCLIVSITNVGSRQIADLRKQFRGRARFLFGKNTLIRKTIREYMKVTGKHELMPLMENIQGNIGLVFTKEEVGNLRKEIMAKKKQCAAKAGVIAPTDVFVKPGPTGMEPTQTAMFQAMDIPTRINRGQIDIVDEVHLIKEGNKVGASEASLLVKLGVKPFYYGIVVEKVYDKGVVFDAKVLDITTNDLAASFYNGLRDVASLCYQINYPTIINVPHTLLHAYKKTLSLGLELNTYSWEGLDTIKQILENPDAFINAGGGGGGDDNKGNTAKEPTPEPTPSVSSEAKPGLFDESSSSSSESE